MTELASDTLNAYTRAAEFWELIESTHLADDPLRPWYADLRHHVGGYSVEYGIGVGGVAATARPDAGVDVSRGMLAFARLRCPQTQMVHGLIEEVTLDIEVDFSYVPGNTLNHFLTPDSIVRALTNIRKNSAEGGILAVDVLTPRYYELSSARMNTLELVTMTSEAVVWHVLSRGTPRDAFEQLFILDRIYAGEVGYRRYFGPFSERGVGEPELRSAFAAAGWTTLAAEDCPFTNPCASMPVKCVLVARAC